MTQSHFFAATILDGRLHIDGIAEWGPREASRLDWWPEDHVGLILPTTEDWKVRTTEELDAAIKEPIRVAATRNIWIHERLGGWGAAAVGGGRPE